MSDLRCPYCGHPLWIETEWVGGFGNSTQVPESIECDGNCGAVWETNGDLRSVPWKDRTA